MMRLTPNCPERVEVTRPAPHRQEIDQLKSILAKAERPMVIAGGPLWDAEAVVQLERFAACYQMPVACSFRRQRLMNSTSPYYAGDLGLGCNPKLLARIKNLTL